MSGDRRSKKTHLADRLREQVYVTFTGLAVIIALQSHAHDLTGQAAATTLSITVFGVLLAAFIAEVITHMIVGSALPDRAEVTHMLRSTVGAVGIVVLPILALVLAAVGVWSVTTALTIASVLLIATLVAVVFLAIRRTAIGPWQQLAVLLALALLGVLVLALEVAAHG
ncbi:hypothetical protein [Microterricola pindariensis]|uniref:Sodium:proton antiporter n=1 Tax=Microterricola pindariensis TaxID=478010 RepID=A0ABX5AZG4_9MICO|nr:hypothetical protein [Microterricola pindariensis]PPL20296.1 hypothetical protein GY24_01765 [Microterricola pindariensis]